MPHPKVNEAAYVGEKHVFFAQQGGGVTVETHEGVKIPDALVAESLLLAIAQELQSIRLWGTGQQNDGGQMVVQR